MTAASASAPAARVRTCPDCGGILQALEPERLTSAEVAADDRSHRDPIAQCLICGYEDASPPAVAATDR